MNKRDVFILITDNDLMVETQFMAEKYVQFISKVKDGTGYLCPKSLDL